MTTTCDDAVKLVKATIASLYKDTGEEARVCLVPYSFYEKIWPQVKGACAYAVPGKDFTGMVEEAAALYFNLKRFHFVGWVKEPVALPQREVDRVFGG